MKINFDLFSENKIEIIEIISNFILDVQFGKIELKTKDENGEIIENDAKDLLLKYLNENLNLENKNYSEIVEYLFKNGLETILYNKINKLINNYLYINFLILIYIIF